jgi:hypothetical protein
MDTGKGLAMLAVVLFFVIFASGVMFQIDREHTRNTVDPDAWAVMATVEQQNQTWAPIVISSMFMNFLVVLLAILGLVAIILKMIGR